MLAAGHVSGLEAPVYLNRATTMGNAKEQVHAWQFYHTAAMYGSIDAHAALGRRYLIGDEHTLYANRVLWLVATIC